MRNHSCESTHCVQDNGIDATTPYPTINDPFNIKSSTHTSALREFLDNSAEVWSNDVCRNWLMGTELLSINTTSLEDAVLFRAEPLFAASKEEARSGESILFAPFHFIGTKFTLMIATPTQPNPPAYFQLPSGVTIDEIRTVRVNARTLIVNVCTLSNGLRIFEVRYFSEKTRLLTEHKLLVDNTRVLLSIRLEMNNVCQFCVLRGNVECICAQTLVLLPPPLPQSNGNHMWMNQVERLASDLEMRPFSRWNVYSEDRNLNQTSFSIAFAVSIMFHRNELHAAKQKLAFMLFKRYHSPALSLEYDTMSSGKRRDDIGHGKRNAVEMCTNSVEMNHKREKIASREDEQDAEKVTKQEEEGSRSMSETKKFECGFCDVRFTQQNHMKQHQLLMHLKVKGFECDVCGKKFGTAGNMRQHKYYIHENPDIKAFACELCPERKYKAKSKLREHERKIHGK
eukprot:CAMPEP_0182447608 /NCGR_PEP_ID=MMETSP1172-20130603/17943_1 /TAXON_ID=708627 /ORGANISM="Timspurckia oligopyrenoides, Strain CCMP3278" /LENGTH=454 /DNA_ID=CAMNT_0024644109 /DNA_START=96 /DNA_END=1460 /DNA_ORIENTATION=+